MIKSGTDQSGELDRRALMNAYRSGALEATSTNLTILRSVTSGSPVKKDQYNGFIPYSAIETAAKHPLATVFGLGAVGGVVLTGSGILGSRAVRWALGSGRVGKADKLANTKALTPLAQGNRPKKEAAVLKSSSQVSPSSQNVISSAIGQFTKRINGLEQGFVDHLTRSDRDRRMELEIFRREILGLLAAAKEQPANASNKEEAKIGLQNMEAKIRQLEDLVVQANRDRRLEFQGFRSEIMGELGVVQSQLSNSVEPDGVKAAIDAALIYHFGDVGAPHSLGSKLEARLVNLEDKVNSPVSTIAIDKLGLSNRSSMLKVWLLLPIRTNKNTTKVGSSACTL